MIDGVHFGEHCCVVALGIDLDGVKHPLALEEGSTENATLVTDLLVGLRDRGLDVTRPTLVVIDGAKALRRAVLDFFDHPVLGRCQLHKIRNVRDKLPERLRSTVAKRMRAAYHADSALEAQAALTTLHGRGAHYLFTVKANQPALRRALARLPWAQAPGLIERQQGHGRAESRSIKVIDLDGTPEAGLFPHGARAIKVIRRRRRTGTAHRSMETVYALTSLDHRDADSRLLACWIRSHWTIENRLHWVRDVTQGEDHSTIRTGNGPQVIAALRNTAINLIRLRGGTNIAAAHRHFSYQPAAVLDALATA